MGQAKNRKRAAAGGTPWPQDAFADLKMLLTDFAFGTADPKAGLFIAASLLHAHRQGIGLAGFAATWRAEMDRVLDGYDAWADGEPFKSEEDRRGWGEFVEGLEVFHARLKELAPRFDGVPVDARPFRHLDEGCTLWQMPLEVADLAAIVNDLEALAAASAGRTLADLARTVAARVGLAWTAVEAETDAYEVEEERAEAAHEELTKTIPWLADTLVDFDRVTRENADDPDRSDGLDADFAFHMLRTFLSDMDEEETYRQLYEPVRDELVAAALAGGEPEEIYERMGRVILPKWTFGDELRSEWRRIAEERRRERSEVEAVLRRRGLH